MKEVSSMIQITIDVGTRYMQDYLDSLLLKKQANYTFKRKEIVSEILVMIMNKGALSNKIMRTPSMPILLKETKCECRFEIFC